MTQETNVIKQPSPPKFINRALNMLLTGVLRSPLHPLLSGSAIVLSFRGRKTGKTYTFPVGYYAYTGDALVVIPLHSWWKNLRGSVPVTVWLKGKPYNGTAEAHQGDEAALQALPPLILASSNLMRVLGIRRDANGQPDAEQAREAARNLALVRISLAK